MTSSFSLKSVLRWLDDNILLLLTFFLLAFIPLYPKIPLWSPIEQYIVRVRVEDLFIVITGVVWLIQVVRGKAKWRSPIFWMVLAYGLVGAASTLSALFLTKTVPLQPLHIGKTLLHYFRYLEYFSLLFFAFSAVKERKHLKWIVALFAIVVVAVTVYGYGQKYFYWPVYSTMNREFSKGIRLYLTQYARVQSTFAGHYDMAAFLVVGLPLLLAVAYQAKNALARYGLYLSFWLGSWLLVLSASRTPFGAYLGGVALVITLTAAMQPDWSKRTRFFLSRSMGTAILVGLLFYYFGADLSERLGHVVNANPQLSSIATALNNTRKMVISDEQVAKFPLSATQLHKLMPQTAPPLSGISTDDLAAAAQEVEDTKDVASSKDQPPLPASSPKAPVKSIPPIFKADDPADLPAGVYQDIPDLVDVATVSATGEKVVTKVKTKRIYSKCALEKELSLCIRLETLWPRAIEGFLLNPALGSGYATLTKEDIYTFTEADSTDNNFLRTLGETGLLGFITFYGCIVIVLWQAGKNVKNPDTLIRAMSIGMIGGSVGLLLNAIYIDVFAASKVAETYWLLCGAFLASVWVVSNPKQKAVGNAETPLFAGLTRSFSNTTSLAAALRAKKSTVGSTSVATSRTRKVSKSKKKV